MRILRITVEAHVGVNFDAVDERQLRLAVFSEAESYGATEVQVRLTLHPDTSTKMCARCEKPSGGTTYCEFCLQFVSTCRGDVQCQCARCRPDLVNRGS